MSLLDRNPELDPHSNASETMGRRVDIIYAALKGIEKSLRIDTSASNAPIATTKSDDYANYVKNRLSKLLPKHST